MNVGKSDHIAKQDAEVENPLNIYAAIKQGADLALSVTLCTVDRSASRSRIWSKMTCNKIHPHSS